MRRTMDRIVDRGSTCEIQNLVLRDIFLERANRLLLMQISLAMAIMMPQSTWPSLRCGDHSLGSRHVRVGSRRHWQQGNVVRCAALQDRDRGGRVFIFGMGYTSQALANALQHQGWDVAGTCRSEEKRAALEERGFRAHLFNPGEEDCLQEEAIRELREASHIVSSIPPISDSGCDPVLASHREELLQATKERLPWMGYLSSTSVYGDWQGEWVDEDTEPRPVEKRAVARWEAEKQWMQFGEEAGGCVRVFRLGGIYGPGRSALDTILRQGETPSVRQRLREQKRFTSRVHVADICQVIVKAMASECTGTGSRVYNVVDDDPSPRSKVMSYARQLLRGGASVDDDDNLSAALRSTPTASNGQASEKRVSNRRVKAELQVELLYPSFRSGLEAIAIASNTPFTKTT